MAKRSTLLPLLCICFSLNSTARAADPIDSTQLRPYLAASTLPQHGILGIAFKGLVGGATMGQTLWQSQTDEDISNTQTIRELIEDLSVEFQSGALIVEQTENGALSLKVLGEGEGLVLNTQTLISLQKTVESNPVLKVKDVADLFEVRSVVAQETAKVNNCLMKANKPEHHAQFHGFKTENEQIFARCCRV
jgi:hypothetical protein